MAPRARHLSRKWGGRVPLEGKQRPTGKDSMKEEGTLFLKRQSQTLDRKERQEWAVPRRGSSAKN